MKKTPVSLFMSALLAASPLAVVLAGCSGSGGFSNQSTPTATATATATPTATAIPLVNQFRGTVSTDTANSGFSNISATGNWKVTSISRSTDLISGFYSFQTGGKAALFQADFSATPLQLKSYDLTTSGSFTISYPSTGRSFVSNGGTITFLASSSNFVTYRFTNARFIENSTGKTFLLNGTGALEGTLRS